MTGLVVSALIFPYRPGRRGNARPSSRRLGLGRRGGGGFPRPRANRDRAGECRYGENRPKPGMGGPKGPFG